MAAIKTTKNKASVTAFLETVDEAKRKDSREILKMMKEITGEKPAMWGSSIIGFGTWHYKSERSKQEGDWFITGFSPRKNNLTLYILPGIGHYKEILSRLGKYKTSVSCLYLNKLADVDIPVLKELISTAWMQMKKQTQQTKK